MRKLIYFTSVLFSIGLVIQSCSSDDDVTYPDNTISFSSAELGIDESESSKTFTINISRAINTASTIDLAVTSTGLVYGTDYTTSPAISDGKISISIPAGQTSASIIVNKVSKFFNGDESIEFNVSSASSDLVINAGTKVSLTFGAIISEGGKLTLNGGEGTSSAVNSVFVDLSGNEQQSIARTSWSLAFYCGDDFAVKLNNTTASAAKQTDIALTDIISSTDSATYDGELLIGRGKGNFDIIDDIKGDLSKSVIKENNVYLVRLGETAANESRLYKIKVTKTANGYSLQYAASGSSKVTTVEIAKNNNYNFIYYSFGSASTVNIEPLKSKWDFRWSYQTYTAGTMPYNFSDFIVINYLAGVTAAEVSEENTLYSTFSSKDLASIKFSSDVNTIGGNWRITAGDEGSKGIKKGVFYLVKDMAGNVYKIQFTKMGLNNDGGTRGYPEFEYELVK